MLRKIQEEKQIKYTYDDIEEAFNFIRKNKSKIAYAYFSHPNVLQCEFVE